MHSLESDATPAVRRDDRIAARLRADSMILAVAVAVVSVVGTALVFIGWAAGFRDLAWHAVLALCIAAVLIAILGAFYVERHRWILSAQTERLRQRNRELRATAVRKDEFLASVSHELRTPLNVVLGYIDLLLDHSFGPLEPAQRDILHRITKNASNLSHLINDLVDLSRIEAGRMRVEIEVVELAPLFADLRAIMEVLLAGRDVAFDTDIAVGCHRLRADPDRLKQIVSNLLVNAVKFTERGSIALRAEAGPRGRVAISVIDTGIGIPSGDQNAIFEPFRQVHDREHRALGAGIGLAISSRLAMLMGGTLGVESAPGNGSRFTLALDGVPAEEPPAPFTLRQVS
jgi:signal transduction histidine kinase